MKATYNLIGAARRNLVKAIENILGEKAVYKKLPTYAYTVGAFTIDRNGTVFCDDGDALERLVHNLIADGYKPEEADTEADTEEPASLTNEVPFDEAEAEPINLTVKVPMNQHTGATLRNLINLVYTRAGLLNKALGTGFRVDEELIEALKDDACTLTTESLLQAIRDFEAEHGKAIDGLTFTPEGITFASLPETTDAEKLRTFTILAGMMNKQALDQKRIQAKAVNDENEKYALRIWLTRLGMNGSEFKEARKVLMANLTGHCAFRTPAEEAKWKARQAEKREALKAAKAETAAEEQEEVETA